MLAQWSIFGLLAAFTVAAAIVLISGLRMTSLADKLADRTGLGEAIAGAVLLGAATSLSGAMVSVTAAYDGLASLAYSNSIGGIAAQTAFLAIADLTYRKANLEHAAAELANVFQAIVLIILLTVPLIAISVEEISVLAIHPVSFVIPFVYIIALVATRHLRENPMWHPVSTRESRTDTPDEEDEATQKKEYVASLCQFRHPDGPDGRIRMDYSQDIGRGDQPFRTVGIARRRLAHRSRDVAA